MATSPSLDFDDQPAPACPVDKPAKRPASKKPSAKATPAAMCARCQVALEPVPQSRGWLRCPKCGWKHKTFDRLKAAKQARRAVLDRAAR